MTPTKEMMQLARKCAVLVADPSEGSIASRILAGEYDDWPLVVVALTAIMETQALVEKKLNECREPCPQCHDAIHNGEYLR